MECPYCGAAMESGALQSSHGIYWLDQPAKYLPPQWVKTGEGLCDADNLMQSPHIPASRCPKCRKIILTY